MNPHRHRLAPDPVFVEVALLRSTNTSMDAIHVLKTRRCIRAYTSQPISREILADLVDCGRLAATAISAGGGHNLALKADGTVVASGDTVGVGDGVGARPLDWQAEASSASPLNFRKSRRLRNRRDDFANFTTRPAPSAHPSQLCGPRSAGRCRVSRSDRGRRRRGSRRRSPCCGKSG